MLYDPKWTPYLWLIERCMAPPSGSDKRITGQALRVLKQSHTILQIVTYLLKNILLLDSDRNLTLAHMTPSLYGSQVPYYELSVVWASKPSNWEYTVGFSHDTEDQSQAGPEAQISVMSKWYKLSWYLVMGWIVFLCWGPKPQYLKNVTVFGNRVFKEVGPNPIWLTTL